MYGGEANSILKRGVELYRVNSLDREDLIVNGDLGRG